MILEKCKKKKKKGQGDLGMVGVLIVVAVTVIVGLVLFQISAQQIGTVTNTVDFTDSFTAPANGTTYNWTGYQAFSDVVIINGSDGVVIASTAYEITNKVVKDGALVVQITPDANDSVAGKTWNITATAQPSTYLDDSAGRSIMGIIVVFLALAVLVVAMTPVGGKLKELVGM